MDTILVANPKGGCGKTTIATNLAGYFARQGQRVVLSDLDQQRSALTWLARRSEHLPNIQGWDGHKEKGFDDKTDPEVVIMDAPAAMRGERLKSAVKQVDKVVIPVQPSPFDTTVSADFLSLLAELKQVRKGKRPLALIGNRVNSRTLAMGQLQQFFNELELPVLGLLRDAQIYVHMALDGTTLFDLPHHRTARDVKQWQELIAWVQS
jgi:chromosome partitioning protein